MNTEEKAKLRQMETSVREIGRTIARVLPPNTGFALLMFDFGPEGSATYVSNASREDMVKMLREQADALEAGCTAPHGMPGHPANTRGRG